MSGDLPGTEVRVDTGSVSLLVEAIGTGPTGPAREQYIDAVNLYSADKLSVGLDSDWIIKNSDNSQPRSYEKWLRLRFSPPFGAITNIRFWTDNYAPVGGWEILWGLATEYKYPSSNRSAYSDRALLVTDPGVLSPNLPINSVENLAVGDGATIFTDWIVLQAIWSNDTQGLSQPDPIILNFAWREA